MFQLRKFERINYRINVHFSLGNTDLTDILFTRATALTQRDVGAGAEQAWLDNVTAVSGYTPIGIVGFNSSHTYFATQVCRLLNNQIQYIGRNTASVALSVAPEVNVLYVKTALL